QRSEARRRCRRLREGWAERAGRRRAADAEDRPHDGRRYGGLIATLRVHTPSFRRKPESIFAFGVEDQNGSRLAPGRRSRGVEQLAQRTKQLAVRMQRFLAIALASRIARKLTQLLPVGRRMQREQL